MTENLSNSTKELKIHDKEIENLNVEIRTLASRTDVRALAKELENQSAGVRLCALKSELNKVIILLLLIFKRKKSCL